jgi:uncharacterized protein YabE (DUF348 family)
MNTEIIITNSTVTLVFEGQDFQITTHSTVIKNVLQELSRSTSGAMKWSMNKG